MLCHYQEGMPKVNLGLAVLKIGLRQNSNFIQEQYSNTWTHSLSDVAAVHIDKVTTGVIYIWLGVLYYVRAGDRETE